MRMSKKRFLIERLPSELKLTVGLARWLRIDFNKTNKIGDDKMDKQLQVILIGMLVDFTRKEVLEKEIIFGAKKGIEKLEAVKNNFFGKFKDFIKKAQEINNPYIPDDIEKFTEDLLLKGAETIEKTVNVDEIIHKILGEEKTAIGI